MTRFHLEMSASTRARQLCPDTLCQPMRPRSAMHRRWASRCVGAVSAVARGSIRRDQNEREKLERLQTAIDQGRRSGISNRTPEEILTAAKAELRNEG
jgi:hypothetical protein